MARGWESKGVADQIEQVKSDRPSRDERGRGSSEDRAQRQRMESLNLSRSRLLQQLERAKHPSHRQVLMNGLQAIESEIDKLKKAESAEE